ncbi:ABC transporter permease [Sulfurifustis variabilis]|uniref:ABC transporter permease n=1 Tax=Sulfurifustis variabilis TaxID=1675686 RepID=A0A1B4V4G1_9GAMM|nr:ABC transporter permease [Sulfurifustis variabilis]BAU48410.1 ABC transporter permease [Sulfurifustis variabilis]
MRNPALVTPPVRPELERQTSDVSHVGAIERPLSAWEKITNVTAVRRVFILVLLAVAWQVYASYLDNPLMFPTFADTARAFWDALVDGGLLGKAWVSIEVLLMGYAAGVGIAAVLTTLAVSTRLGNDLLATLTAMFNPLPAIALLPLAMLWFGLGYASLVFVLIHAVLWPLSLNTHSGFMAVSDTLRMAGRNYGLKGLRYVAGILIPAAFPSILAGLKIGWAFAWRTLIAAELVFGVSSGSGGLGWFIFENKNELEIAYVFAGLGTVIIIGLLVENVVFRWIEERTVRKWGMQR